MQGVGAAWLMVFVNGGSMYVALTQTVSALPFFILALPAGAIGDIVDRRKVILLTEIWMVVVAVVLAVMTIAGRMSPVAAIAVRSFAGVPVSDSDPNCIRPAPIDPSGGIFGRALSEKPTG